MSKYILIKDFKKLKEDIKNSKKELYLKLIEEAENCFCLPLSPLPPKKSTTYLSQCVLNLTLAYKLSEDKKYFDEALTFIKTICAYPYWGNDHLVNVDLSASWILFGLSLAYNYLEDDLSIDDKIIIEEKILKQANIMYEYIQEHEESWPKHYFQNHNWINFTGLAMVSYALEDKYQEVKKYREIAKKNFAIVFSYLPDDGSDYEGVTYWRYGVLWLMIYADLVLDREGINYFQTSSFLKNTFYYRLYQSASEINKQLNFGDCHDTHSANSIAMYYKFASVYKNGYSQKLGNLILNNYLYEEQIESKIKPGILKEAWLSLIWYDPNILEKDFSSLNKFNYFEDLSLITLRTGFNKDDLVFSIKCGFPGGKKQWQIVTEKYLKENKWISSLSHHHPDNLHYIITCNREYLAIDDGYNRNIKPFDHNVLLVDNIYTDKEDVNDVYMESIKKRLLENKDYNPYDYHGEVSYLYHDENLTCFKLENQALYPLNLKMKEVSRFVFTNNLDYFIFIDNFISEEEHLYQSVVNFNHLPKEIKQNVYSLSNFQTFNYQVLSKDSLLKKIEEHEIKAIMTTQEKDVFTRSKRYSLIYSTDKKQNNHCHIEIFNRKNEDMYLNNNTLKINENAYLLMKNDLEFNFIGDYLYFEKENSKIKKIVLINGTYLEYQSKILIDEQTKKTLVLGGENALLK